MISHDIYKDGRYFTTSYMDVQNIVNTSFLEGYIEVYLKQVLLGLKMGFR